MARMCRGGDTSDSDHVAVLGARFNRDSFSDTTRGPQRKKCAKKKGGLKRECP